jgi:hypothetical protein
VLSLLLTIAIQKLLTCSDKSFSTAIQSFDELFFAHVAAYMPLRLKKQKSSRYRSRYQSDHSILIVVSLAPTVEIAEKPVVRVGDGRNLKEV